MQKKVLVIFGTRPEAIKMAPVIRQLECCPDFESIVCITAQHRQMLDQVLDMFHIMPDYDLDIMRDNQDLFSVTNRVLTELNAVISESQPSLILVQGDTTTTFAASLASFYLKIPVGHVEAGLRTYDNHSPFPEEGNRRMTTTIATFHFAPTKWSENNLLKEGVSKENIFVTGNTIVDALYYVSNLISTPDQACILQKELAFSGDRKIVLITGHRRESFGQGFKNICNAIIKLAQLFTEVDFVYPVHLNPNVQEPVQNILAQKKLPNVHLISPVKYTTFIYLLKKAYLVLTDSGGIQEEAVSFGKPTLVMRNTTERPEGVKAGTVKLVGNKQENIFNECKNLLINKSKYKKMAKVKSVYGDGKAAERIVKILYERL